MASDPVNVSDFTELAKQALPKAVYDFFAGGAEDEWTLKQNTAAFQTFRLRPRVLVDSSHVDLSTNILGYKISAPIMIAPPPTSMHKLAHPEGELATARAAADAGTIMDIKWLQSITNLPILVKGILTAEDAELAVQTGAAGIVVSNHGGRQLDFASASITSLEEVVHAVRGRVPVLFDGGIRCGTDVFKALALGVQAVLVGRPVIFGLAAKGESGVKKLLEMLHDELELAMSLCGCPSVKDITRSHVRTEHEMMRYML